MYVWLHIYDQNEALIYTHLNDSTPLRQKLEWPQIDKVTQRLYKTNFQITPRIVSDDSLLTLLFVRN